jgi:acetyl-CoA carboxylase beta subunit
MSWLQRDRKRIKKSDKPERPDLPEGLWTKCEGCGEALFQTVLEENLWTCPEVRPSLPHSVAHLSGHPRRRGLVRGA